METFVQDNQTILKCHEKNVDLYMGRIALTTWHDQGHKGSHVEVD